MLSLFAFHRQVSIDLFATRSGNLLFLLWFVFLAVFLRAWHCCLILKFGYNSFEWLSLLAFICKSIEISAIYCLYYASFLCLPFISFSLPPKRTWNWILSSCEIIKIAHDWILRHVCKLNQYGMLWIVGQRLWLIIQCFREGPWESFIRLPVCLSSNWLITSGRTRAFWIIKWAFSSPTPTPTPNWFTWVPAGFTELAAKCCKVFNESFRWAGELISWMCWGCQVSLCLCYFFGN